MAQWRVISRQPFDGNSSATVERVRPSRDGHDLGVVAVSYYPTVKMGKVYSDEEPRALLDPRPTFVD